MLQAAFVAHLNNKKRGILVLVPDQDLHITFNFTSTLPGKGVD